MIYDGTLNIAVGMSAKSKIWKNTKYTWSKFVDKLKAGHKTNETFREYMKATKDEQSKIKDVGGYVGGYLRNGRRKPENVVHRQLMTLDIDFAHAHFWEDFILQFDNAAVLHGTHKWSEENPRYRLIIPMSREATPDEYVAVSRAIAGDLDIELFDNTTFETNRLMFWPSSPKDVDYYFEFQDGPWVDVDEILASYYADWKDSSLWPTAEKQFHKIKDATEKQEDPETKKGIVGAFCRAYTITEAIQEHLTEVYTPATEGRYTYLKGTTAAGMIIYDDKFAYSHHGTDPCGGKLCNAFDLVRIHKFGHLDSNAQTSGSRSKSFASMEEIARKDKRVRKVIAAENLVDAKYDFVEEIAEEENIDWMEELEVDSKGKYTSSAVNINIIFSNDVRLKQIFRLNDFDGKRYVFKSMPWRRVTKPEPVKNVDYSGLRNYLESLYGITGTLKIDDAMALEFEKNHYHPIKDYLKKVEWDGEKRVDTLLIDYLGAEDNLYTREATRKMLVGAVGRIFRPGVKFDLIVTLVGEQGCGKSTIIKKLGQQWFSDTFMTVHGKEALEQIQGAWMIEIAELSGFRKAEVEAIKHFMSKQEDTFRPAYARESETYQRQCVFVATTNRNDFLKDPTGNRRFLPIDLYPVNKTKSVWNDFTQYEIDQVWAETVEMYNAGEPLFMSKKATELAKEEQIRHSEVDDRRGLIDNYLNMLLPEDWEDMDLMDRRTYIEDPITKKGTQERVYVCIAEIWTECLGKEKEDMNRYNTRDLNDILRSFEDWEKSKSTKRFKMYGHQKYYFRKL